MGKRGCDLFVLVRTEEEGKANKRERVKASGGRQTVGGSMARADQA